MPREHDLEDMLPLKCFCLPSQITGTVPPFNFYSPAKLLNGSVHVGLQKYLLIL